MDTNNKPESGAGGTFEVDADGNVRLVQPPTARHEDGDCARDAEGNPVEQAVTKTEPALPPPAAE